MSSLAPHRWHIPGAALVHKHPVGILLVGATAAMTLVVGAAVASAWQGRLHPAYALGASVMTVGLGGLFTWWRYQVLRDREVDEAEPISITELWLNRIADEPTGAWEIVPPAVPAYENPPRVVSSTTYVRRSHPADDDLAMQLQRELMEDTGEVGRC